MSRGYRLPEGEAFTDDISCALVFFPNKPEYRQALRGSLDYLTTWLAWERDPEKRGLDAARAWTLANEMTQECIEMGVCLDDLIDAIKKLNDREIYIPDCFCDSVEINPPPPIIPDVDNEDGDPPPTYGGEPVADWLDWRRKVCGNVDAYINYICSQNSNLQTAISLGTVAIALIAAILGVLASGGLLIPIAWGTAATVVGGLISGASALMFDDVCDQLTSGAEDIKEAVVCSGDLGEVIQGLIDSDAWTFFYQFVDWSQAARALRAGELNGEFFDGNLSDDSCDNLCDDSIFKYTWQESTQGWPDTSTFFQSDGHLTMKSHTDSGGGSWGAAGARTGEQICATFGIDCPITVGRITFDFQFNTGTGSAVDNRFRLRVIGAGGSPIEVSPEFHADNYTPDQWQSFEWDLDGEIELRATSAAIEIWLFRGEPAPDGQYIFLDNLAGRP